MPCGRPPSTRMPISPASSTSLCSPCPTPFQCSWPTPTPTSRMVHSSCFPHVWTKQTPPCFVWWKAVTHLNPLTSPACFAPHCPITLLPKLFHLQCSAASTPEQHLLYLCLALASHSWTICMPACSQTALYDACTNSRNPHPHTVETSRLADWISITLHCHLPVFL